MARVGRFGIAGLGLVAAAVAVSACHPVRHTQAHRSVFDGRPLRAVDRLDCPDVEGRLTRVSIAADGRACEYAGPEGEAVSLSVLALNGQTPQAALAPIEATLKDGAADAARSPAPADADHDDDDATAATTTTTTTPNTKPGKTRDKADINLPFLHVHTDGDKAEVSLPGIDVHADGDNAQVKTGWGKNTTINAHNGGAEIRAGDVDKSGAHLVYILASDRAGDDGYKAKGYVAEGPANGPLVVGVFKARDHRGNRHGTRDLERLIERNVRG
jgi:hypothetical protein